MTSLTMQLHALLLEIKATDSDQRCALRSRLDTLIREMEAQALPVEPGARALNEKLLNDAIEAQFDNLPV
jgi:hypothetical protein